MNRQILNRTFRLKLALTDNCRKTSFKKKEFLTTKMTARLKIPTDKRKMTKIEWLYRYTDIRNLIRKSFAFKRVGNWW